jgi:hypothetical protein
MYPVIVTETSGNLSKQSSNIMLEAISESTRRGYLETFSRATYGTNTKIFPKAKPYRGQVEMLVDSLRNSDKSMQNIVRKMKPMPDEGIRTVRARLYYSKTPMGVPPVDGDLANFVLGFAEPIFGQSEPPVKRIFSMAKLGLNAGVINGTAAINKQLTDQIISNFASIYELQADLPAWPAHVDIEYTLNGKTGFKSKFKFLLSTKPVNTGTQDLGAAILDKMAYQPGLQGRGVLQITFEREYRFLQTSYPTATASATFGRIEMNSPTSAVSCKGDGCKSWEKSLPTLYLRIDKSEMSWKEIAEAWFASFDEFQILVRKVSLNLDTMTLEPKETELVFQVDAYTGGKKIIDVQKSTPRNWFESMVQRGPAIEGRIMPSIDSNAAKNLNSLMETNLTALLFSTQK